MGSAASVDGLNNENINDLKLSLASEPSPSYQPSQIVIQRLRKAIILRAYNVRRGAVLTLDEQFRKYAFKSNDCDGDRMKSGVLYIKLSDVMNELNIAGTNSPIEDLFRLVSGAKNVTAIVYSDFVSFLETGNLPLSVDGSTAQMLNSLSSPSLSIHKPPLPLTQKISGKVAGSVKDPLTSPSSSSRRTHLGQVDSNSTTALHSSSCNNTPRRLRKLDATGAGSASEMDTVSVSSSDGQTAASFPKPLDLSLEGRFGDSTCSALSVSKGLALALAIHENSNNKNKVPPSALWRKREVVRQERTVSYTTIDADGQLQELTEKETSQTEVLHMECKDTGEFAHRETTQYEQLETFNNEVVSESTGVEEYIHLKSQEDEFEFMDSTMPKKDAHGDPEREEAVSPRGGEGRGEGEGETGLDDAHNHATGYPSDYFPFQQQSHEEYYDGQLVEEETEFPDNYYHRNGYSSVDHAADDNSDGEHEGGHEGTGIAALDYDDLTEEEKMQMDEEVELWKAAVERQREDRERGSQTVEEVEMEMGAEGKVDTVNVQPPEGERRETMMNYMPLDDEMDSVETASPAGEMEIEKGEREWASDGID